MAEPVIVKRLPVSYKGAPIESLALIMGAPEYAQADSICKAESTIDHAQEGEIENISAIARGTEWN